MPSDSNSAGSSPRRSQDFRRPPNINLFSPDDVDNPLPSPPYQRDPAPSHRTVLEDFSVSPAYTPHSTFDLHAPDGMADSKQDPEKEPEKPSRTVHYPDDIEQAIPRMPELARVYTFESSHHGSDDDEEYDWSGDEDLVDEEAKFEEAMGVKRKKTGWGFKR